MLLHHKVSAVPCFYDVFCGPVYIRLSQMILFVALLSLIFSRLDALEVLQLLLWNMELKGSHPIDVTEPYN